MFNPGDHVLVDGRDAKVLDGPFYRPGDDQPWYLLGGSSEGTGYRFMARKDQITRVIQ